MIGFVLPTPVLESTRLVLRAPVASDVDAFTAFWTTERARWHGGPFTPGRCWRNLGTQIGHWVMRGYGGFLMTERESGRAVGFVGPWHPGEWPEAEIGWSVFDPADEGRGFAAEGARRVLDHVFGDLGWSTAVSYVDPANARSIALAERLGARRDAEAARPPQGEDDEPCLVFRHPHPAEAAA
ncbi:MAG: GNAT family N-acetyltransferase [Pseudomonadota bacterium]